ILVLVIFILLKNSNAAEAQAEILVNAVYINVTQKTSTLLSTHNISVDDNQAKAYNKYIINEVAMKELVKEINKKVTEINDSNTNEEDYVTAKNGEKVLRISKNGQRYLIFDNMSFTAPTKEAIVKPKYDTTYQFKANDKQRTVHAEKNKTTVLGEF